MSINRKREGFERGDLLALAAVAGMKSAPANEMLDRVLTAVRRWPEFAAKAGVPDRRVSEIQEQHLTGL
jgi:serine/threonine-protein kinase HipA